MMTHLNPRRNLPIAGIVAFALCSTWSIRHLLAANARHDTNLFWIPAVAIELFTAWCVYNVVEQARLITQSNISKQDRRFYSLILALFLLVTIPTLAASIIANAVEFGGNLLLGSLFPIACIGCAIGAALPDTVKRHETRRQADANERKVEARQRQEERKQLSMQKQEAASKAQARRKQLSSLGKAEATFVKLCQDPSKSQSSIAQELSISRQAVSNHMSRLEQIGAIRRNGEGIEILWDIAIV